MLETLDQLKIPHVIKAEPLKTYSSFAQMWGLNKLHAEQIRQNSENIRNRNEFLTLACAAKMIFNTDIVNSTQNWNATTYHLANVVVDLKEMHIMTLMQLKILNPEGFAQEFADDIKNKAFGTLIDPIATQILQNGNLYDAAQYGLAYKILDLEGFNSSQTRNNIKEALENFNPIIVCPPDRLNADIGGQKMHLKREGAVRGLFPEYMTPKDNLKFSNLSKKILNTNSSSTELINHLTNCGLEMAILSAEEVDFDENGISLIIPHSQKDIFDIHNLPERRRF